jgi:hypothetical protein
MVVRGKLQCGGNNPVGLYLPIKAAVVKGTVLRDFLINTTIMQFSFIEEYILDKL